MPRVFTPRGSILSAHNTSHLLYAVYMESRMPDENLTEWIAGVIERAASENHRVRNCCAGHFLGDLIAMGTLEHVH